MRVETERLSFEIPPNWRDITNYTFRDKNRREKLSVSYGPRAAGTGTAQALLAEKRRDLELSLGATCTFLAEKEASVCGSPARQLAFTFGDRGRAFVERWAVALLGQFAYVHISYTALATDAKSEERFEHVLRSATLGDKAASAAAPDAYVSRCAGRVRLDVPISLLPVRNYQCISSDETMRLNLCVYDLRSPGTPPTSPEDEIQSRTQDGTTAETMRTRQLAPGRAVGRLVDCVLVLESAGGTRRSALFQGLFTLSEDMVVTLGGQAPAERASDLEGALLKMVESLTLLE